MPTNDLKDSAIIPMLAEEDLQQAREFWKSTVGVEEVWADEKGGEVAFRAGRTVFAIYQHQGGSKADHTQLAFQVTDVSTAKQRLERKGVRFEEYDLPNVKTKNGIAEMGEGGQGAWFLDPGNNIIGIFTESTTMLDAMGARGQMAGAGMGTSY